MKHIALAVAAVVVAVVVVLIVVALSINLWDNKTKEESTQTPQTTHTPTYPPRKGLQQPPPYPPGEGLQGVVDESVYELWQRGLMDKVAILAYGFLHNNTRIEVNNNTIGIRLGFYNKTDPEVVEIVKLVIDKRAPGTPIEIFENITFRLDQNHIPG